jgi:hypothetical protein
LTSTKNFCEFTFAITFNYIFVSQSTISSNERRLPISFIHQFVMRSRADGRTNSAINNRSSFLTIRNVI